jgi:GcrA cell cycle regulator
MSWTPERIDALCRMWAQGNSASQIAGELRVFTRNAIIGKVHRLGLSREDQSLKAKRTAKRKRKQVFRPSFSGMPPCRRAAPREPIIALVPKMLPLSELTAQTCRWPIGDPRSEDFGFCGHSCRSDQPYCRHHSWLSNAVRGQGRAGSGEEDSAGSLRATSPQRSPLRAVRSVMMPTRQAG